jgi:hypothetical protein
MTSPERNRAVYREPILDTHMAGPFPILGIPNSAVIGKTTVPPTDKASGTTVHSPTAKLSGLDLSSSVREGRILTSMVSGHSPRGRNPSHSR